MKHPLLTITATLGILPLLAAGCVERPSKRAESSTLPATVSSTSPIVTSPFAATSTPTAQAGPLKAGKTVRIPSGPLFVLPAGWNAKKEGNGLRVGTGNLDTERCVVELEAAMATPALRGINAIYSEYGITCSETTCRFDRSDISKTLPVAMIDGVAKIEVPGGNGDRTAIARVADSQTIILTYCPNDPTMKEADMMTILLQKYQP